MVPKVFTLCVIFGVLAVSQMEAQKTTQPPSIEDLEDLLEDLKLDTKGILSELGRINTRCQVGSRLVRKIQDEVAPMIRLVNEQQSTITDSFKQQIAELLHRADKALGDIQEAGSQAIAAKPRINVLKKRVGDIGKADTQQDVLAGSVDTMMCKTKTEFLKDAGTIVSKLDMNLDALSSDVSDLETFNNGKICEYGTSTIDPFKPHFVSFDTEFSVLPPEVCVSLTGWSAHVPNLGQGNPYAGGGASLTSILVSANADKVSRNGFFLSLVAKPDAKILRNLKDVYVRWAACQNLIEEPLEANTTTAVTTATTATTMETDPCAALPNNYIRYNSTCVRVYDMGKTYNDSSSCCVDDGTGLFIIQDPVLDTELLKQAVDEENLELFGQGLWVGADDLAVQGMFQWNDGSPLPSNSPLWLNGAPSTGVTDRCVNFFPGSSSLNNIDCSNGRFFVCSLKF